MACEWDIQNPDKMVLGLGDLNGHVGRLIKSFEGVHGGNKIDKRNKRNADCLTPFIAKLKKTA